MEERKECESCEALLRLNTPDVIDYRIKMDLSNYGHAVVYQLVRECDGAILFTDEDFGEPYDIFYQVFAKAKSYIENKEGRRFAKTQ